MANNGRRSLVTLKEVSERALVSLGTASRVLNGHPNVQPDIRLRVLTAASELGYPIEKARANYYNKNSEPNNGAYVDPVLFNQSNAPAISHVAFVCRPIISPLMDKAYNPYFSAMLYGVEAECRQQKLHLTYRLIEDTDLSIEEGQKNLRESGTEGLLLINFINENLVKGLLELGLPTVLVDHFFANVPLDMVTHENYNGSMRAVQYIIDKGHRRIGFVNGLPHYTIQRRFEGYRRALEEANIPFDWDLIVPGDLKIEGGQAAADYILDHKLDCTAYFCANDETAIGLIQRLHARGVRVPQDISVVGFDDVESARLISPPLTTVKGNPAGVGRMAVRRLLERVKSPDLPITQTLIHTSLVERDSVRSLE